MPRKSTHNFVSVLLRAIPLPLLLLALLIVPGCGTTELFKAPSDGKVHVEVWTMWQGPEEQNFRQVVALYNKTHPGVVVENLGNVDDTKTVRAIVAGVPPDACTISIPGYLGTFAANDAIMPIDKQFAASGLKPSDYTPGALGQCYYKGHLYAVPFLLDCQALFYNKTAFKAAGLDPSHPPRTFEELVADAKRLVKRDPEGRLVQIGMTPISADQLLGVYGSGLFDKRTQNVTANLPGNVEALTNYKKLMDAQGRFEAVDAFGLGFSSTTSNFDPFYSGQIAMKIDGEWIPHLIAEFSPKTDYGVAPFPYPADEPQKAGLVWLGSNNMCIPKEAKHPKEAWDFIQWTQTPQVQEMFAKSMRNVPNIKSVLHDPKLRTGSPEAVKFGQFLDLADTRNPRFFPPLPIASLYINQIQTASDSVAYGRETPQVALDGVQSRCTREMDKYR